MPTTINAEAEKPKSVVQGGEFLRAKKSSRPNERFDTVSYNITYNETPNPLIISRFPKNRELTQYLANFVVSDLEYGSIKHSKTGRTIAHVAVSNWESAAQKLIKNYWTARSDNAEQDDPRIVIAELKDKRGLSVLDSALMKLTPANSMLRTA